MMPEIKRGVTVLQARILINATDAWEAGSALNDSVTLAGREEHLIQLVKAGFLLSRTHGRRTQYKITPAGREFAFYLERLERAFEE